MQNLHRHFNTTQTPQTEVAPGKQQVENSAGGFVFAIDDWARLDRFLVLGVEGGTYYASERKLAIENAECVTRCIKADGLRTVARIEEISVNGRAPKNDQAIFALAMCTHFGDVSTRKAAFAAVQKVCRIGTHIFMFCEYRQAFGGWGRLMRNAIRAWYNDRHPEQVAHQALKYQQRNGWSHRDLLRLAHPKSESNNGMYRYIVGKSVGKLGMPELVAAFEQAKTADTKTLVNLIIDHNLTREMVPTEMLNEPSVWEALLIKMPLTAMIRNLGKMSSIGVLKPMSNGTSLVMNKLHDADAIKKARVHPIALLSALKVYEQGHGEKGKLKWDAVPQVVDSLDDAFYLSFGALPCTGKRWMLALDVSGSMASGAIAGVPGLTPRVASAAMAMVTAKSEPDYAICGFSTDFIPLTISPRQRLDDVVRTISGLPFSGTDCALPMLYAIKHGLSIDCFVIYTDNETWAGHIHPFQALKKYREKTGINAKLVTVGMTSTWFSIADPSDAGMLDCVGFDTATPQIISDFA